MASKRAKKPEAAPEKTDEGNKPVASPEQETPIAPPEQETPVTEKRSWPEVVTVRYTGNKTLTDAIVGAPSGARYRVLGGYIRVHGQDVDFILGLGHFEAA